MSRVPQGVGEYQPGSLWQMVEIVDFIHTKFRSSC